ncbi:MAG: right-handed parallel beta-helix repeat-containing protein [Verrucomicrobiales bacterium]|nr:right-handed parallel beta-helix repeat-containing protein [Verrucomicrobiales bacterium]
MNRFLLSFASFCCALVIFPTAMQAAVEYHVSASAKAGGDGSGKAPFQTLQQARDGIRAARKSGLVKKNEAVTVSIAAGVYRLQQTLEFSKDDGGTAKAPVIYRAARPGAVRIRGGVTLKPADFAPLADQAVLARLDPAVRSKVLVCDLSKQGLGTIVELKKSFSGTPGGPWLYVDAAPMTLARWPNKDAANEGWAGFSKVIDTGLPKADAKDPQLKKLRPGSFVLDDARPARWNLKEGVWLLGYWTHDWSDEVIRIAAYDKEKKVISLAAPHHYGIKGGTWGKAQRRFFALNVLEELDAPGEWYLDRVRQRLYFYPQNPLEKATIVLATMTQDLLAVKAAKHMKFENLAFEYSQGSGISLAGTQQVEVAGCEIANLSGGGMRVSGSNNTVRSCDLFNLGTHGISVSGGDRKSLTPGENLVINNEIHHYGLFKRTYAAGVRITGCGNIVRNNVIHDAPHNAVLYSGNEHLFELNEVYRVVMETGDSGAFYTGRDWTSQGNVLRHNYIHDLGKGDAKHANTMGVYLDDCDSGDRIEGNVFYRAGRAIMIGGGRNNPILNNLMIDCAIGLHIDSRGMTWKQWNVPSGGWWLEKKAMDMNYQKPPWSERYPKLAKIMKDSPREPLYNPVRNNVFVDCVQKVYNFDAKVLKLIDKLEIENNLVVNTGAATKIGTAVKVKGFRVLSGAADKPMDLGFADFPAQDFQLKKNARLLKELPSFKPIPFDKIGLFEDAYRTDLKVK